tara:strand:- start:822 stop:944 length:123 start_codon:yes stop_codon:yes gene_type:complete
LISHTFGKTFNVSGKNILKNYIKGKFKIKLNMDITVSHGY